MKGNLVKGNLAGRKMIVNEEPRMIKPNLKRGRLARIGGLDMVLEIERNEKLSSRLLTITEVAQILNAHPNTVRRWADDGIITCYRLGVRGDRRFDSDEVKTFLKDYARA